MSNLLNIPHGNASYRWDRWTDGKAHRATQGKHFSCSLEAFRRALSTHAGRNGLRVKTRKVSGEVLAFQFFKRGGR